MAARKIILVIGGARSGKSSFAYKLANSFSKKIVYIATAEGLDSEMKERIRRHKKNRRRQIKTIEEPKDLNRIKRLIGKGVKTVLFECLTLLVSNMACSNTKGQKVTKEIKDFISYLRKKGLTAIFVSNEVGLGIVPDNRLSRAFRDLQGLVNQEVARLADEVYMLIAGIPVRIK